MSSDYQPRNLGKGIKWNLAHADRPSIQSGSAPLSLLGFANTTSFASLPHYFSASKRTVFSLCMWRCTRRLTLREKNLSGRRNSRSAQGSIRYKAIRGGLHFHTAGLKWHRKRSSFIHDIERNSDKRKPFMAKSTGRSLSPSGTSTEGNILILRKKYAEYGRAWYISKEGHAGHMRRLFSLGRANYKRAAEDIRPWKNGEYKFSRSRMLLTCLSNFIGRSFALTGTCLKSFNISGQVTLSAAKGRRPHNCGKQFC